MDFRNLLLLPGRDGLMNEESDVWNMNEDNDQTDPATELREDFGHSNQHEEQLLHDALGAGANAGSMVDMAFVTPDPLSELVWSPHKGLSLKCAASSFCDRKPPILGGAGPTFTHKQSAPGKKFRSSQPSSKNDCDNKDISTRSNGGHLGALIMRPRRIIEKGIGNNAKEMNEADAEEDLQDHLGKEIAAPMCMQMAEAAELIENKSLNFPGCVDERKIKVEFMVKDELELDRVALERPAEFAGEDGREGPGKPSTRIDYALASDILVQRGCQASASLPSSEKRESTAENELLNINVEALESISHQLVEKMKYAGERVEADRSQSYTRPYKKRKKDKEKALSDEYVVGRNSNSYDDNYECLESCAGTSSKRGYEQQLAIANKRFKTQIHSDDRSTSFKGQDSSFRNWIANMIKPSPNSDADSQSALALTHAQSDNALDGSNKQLVVWKKSRDEQNVGPSTKGRLRLSHEAYYNKEERYKDSVSESFDANATPLAFHIENNISGWEALVRKETLDKSSLGNENINESVLGNSEAVLGWPNMLCFDHGGCDENQMIVSAKNKVACDPLITIGDDINGKSSSSSMGKRRKNNGEDIASDVRAGVRTSPSSGDGEDHLKSLWISRLSVKTPCSAANLDSEDQTRDRPNSTGKREIQRCAVDCGCSTCFDRTGGHDDQFNPMLLSTRFTSSEAMAAVMARRFDALKQILSNVRETSTEERITCVRETTCKIVQK